MDDPALSPGFDFTRHMRLLCGDMAVRLPELSHIDFTRVAVRFCQTRKHVQHSVFASLTPLRFENGHATTKRRGRHWSIEKVLDGGGQEMLYLLSFYLPRFLNLPFRDKLSTVVHELWHIGPSFDGDVRRHAGRCWAHTGSQARYDQVMDGLADKWLALSPPEELYAFLKLSFRSLQARHGRIYGTRIRTPKLLPG